MKLKQQDVKEFEQLTSNHNKDLQENKTINMRKIAYVVLLYLLLSLARGIDFIFFSMVSLVLIAWLIFEIKEFLSKPQRYLSYIGVFLSIFSPIVFFGFSNNLASFHPRQEDIFLIKISVVILFFSCAFLHLLNIMHEDYRENLELQIGNFRATFLVSLFFTLSLVSSAFASFNTAHNYIATVRPVTFTLNKAENLFNEEYDEWNSAFGTIDCMSSDLPAGTTFALNVSSLLGVRRYKMADICLADERKDKQLIYKKS